MKVAAAGLASFAACVKASRSSSVWHLPVGFVASYDARQE